MEQPELRVFLEKAESQLAGIRGGLLLAAQNGFSAHDAEIAASRIETIEGDALSIGLDAVSGFSARLRSLAGDGSGGANPALDVVAAVEAALLHFSLRSDDFLDDVDGLIEASFSHLNGNGRGGTDGIEAATEAEDWVNFEIDDETLEIFQSEADGLLGNINVNLQILGSSPNDTNALWEIRRNAHTFKGAAGIVGFRTASSLAHRVEDLLDKMVESRCPADAMVVELLKSAADKLSKMTAGTDTDDAVVAAALGADLDAVLASLSASEIKNVHNGAQVRDGALHRAEPAQAAATPIVRVSLARLDELLRLSRLLVASSVDSQSHLANEISHKLQQLRMVRFGTLETRLSRAVHVTCQEENKNASLLVSGADVEIDTQVIDALIEPLLHLLKNAVVHGIEPAETRRLLGKPEKGQIRIEVTTDGTKLVVTVGDEGTGISPAKLIEKAVANDLLTADASRKMTEQDAIELIFHRGFTTAESLNMNAGRGVGMCIVRQSVESHGGNLAVVSEPQKGASFIITMPVVQTMAAAPLPAAQLSQSNGIPLVLIVDDSSSIRRQMAKFVQEAGLRAITAVDGADALELLLNGTHEPDLILSDVEMPNMNGWEFLEYLKTDDNLGHVPVVMVTSLDADEYRQMASRLGASDYIVKPFGSTDLENVIAKFCAVSA